jgi:hypothetical protein
MEDVGRRADDVPSVGHDDALLVQVAVNGPTQNHRMDRKRRRRRRRRAGVALAFFSSFCFLGFLLGARRRRRFPGHEFLDLPLALFVQLSQLGHPFSPPLRQQLRRETRRRRRSRRIHVGKEEVGEFDQELPGVSEDRQGRRAVEEEVFLAQIDRHDFGSAVEFRPVAQTEVAGHAGQEDEVRPLQGGAPAVPALQGMAPPQQPPRHRRQKNPNAQLLQRQNQLGQPLWTKHRLVMPPQQNNKERKEGKGRKGKKEGKEGKERRETETKENKQTGK